jgi:hypothetical protein
VSRHWKELIVMLEAARNPKKRATQLLVAIDYIREYFPDGDKEWVLPVITFFSNQRVFPIVSDNVLQPFDENAVRRQFLRELSFFDNEADFEMRFRDFHNRYERFRNRKRREYNAHAAAFRPSQTFHFPASLPGNKKCKSVSVVFGHIRVASWKALIRRVSAAVKRLGDLAVDAKPQEL